MLLHGPQYEYAAPNPPGGLEDSIIQSRELPTFQFTSTGKRKALLIGINYFGSRGELRGAINDVKNMATYLNGNFGFAAEDMVILTDDKQRPMSQPTKLNILRAMHWLVRDAQPSDNLFFQYSGEPPEAVKFLHRLTCFVGHGAQLIDPDGDEDDGYDEVIFPVDFREFGVIKDDEMHEIMIKDLPSDVRFTAIFDSSHAGCALDLPYIYSTQGVLK